MTAFDEAWDIAKHQGRRLDAELKLEEDPYAGVLAHTPVAGSKGNRAGLIRAIADRLRMEEMMDLFMGGGQVGFSARPPVFYGGNDLNSLLLDLHRRVKDDPDALRWNQLDEYSYGVGDRPRLTTPDPTDTRVAELPEITQPFADAFHEATGGFGMPEDRILNIPMRFNEMRARLNEILLNHPNAPFDSAAARERDRLVAMIQEQSMNNYFRISQHKGHKGKGIEQIPDLWYVTSPTRGPSKIKQNSMSAEDQLKRHHAKTIGDKVDVFSDYADNAMRILGDEFGGASPLRSRHFFYPEASSPHHMAKTKASRDPSDEDYNYDIWSKIMRNWILNQGSYEEDMLPLALEMAGPRTLNVSDSPYLGAVVGEHHSKLGSKHDFGEPGRFAHNLHTALRPLSDISNVLAFNTGDWRKRIPLEISRMGHTDEEGKPLGDTYQDRMNHLYNLAGLGYGQLSDRSDKGSGAKEAKRVGESIGHNLSWLSQAELDRILGQPNALGSFYPPGYRGSWRHNQFGTSPT